jgi:thiol-activated cytolysin
MPSETDANNASKRSNLTRTALASLVAWCYCFIFLTAALLAAQPSDNAVASNGNVTTDDQAAINDIFMSLKSAPPVGYNRDLLLSVDLTPKQLGDEGKQKTTGQGGVTWCEKTKVSAQNKIDENLLLNPAQGTIYPGALVMLDSALTEGVPNAFVPSGRAPITLSIDLPGSEKFSSRAVPNPKSSSVEIAIDEMRNRWLTQVATEGFVQPMRMVGLNHTAYSDEQIGVELGASAQWGKGNLVSARVNTQSKTEHNTVFAMFRQVYYAVSADLPETLNPASAFGPQVTASDIKQLALGEKRGLGFVQRVDYGRIIVVKMVTNKAVRKVDAENALKYSTAGGDFSADAKAKYDSIKRDSQFSYFILGGGQAGVSDFVDSQNPENIKAMINGSRPFSASSPGVPISYKVIDLRDGQMAKMTSSADYIKTDCEFQRDGSFKLKMDGGYVGWFEISYLHHGEDGSDQPVPVTLKTGHVTAGWSRPFTLPGDAWNIHITGSYFTGLAWEPTRKGLDVSLPKPPRDHEDKCWGIWGTTIHNGGGKC